jgi:hypothetical protein
MFNIIFEWAQRWRPGNCVLSCTELATWTPICYKKCSPLFWNCRDESNGGLPSFLYLYIIFILYYNGRDLAMNWSLPESNWLVSKRAAYRFLNCLLVLVDRGPKVRDIKNVKTQEDKVSIYRSTVPGDCSIGLYMRSLHLIIAVASKPKESSHKN